MSWPSGTLAKTYLDQGSDSPASARAQLLAALQAIDSIVGARGIASGICDLGSDGKIPATRLDGSSVLQSLLAVDGHGSLLDADKLDGKQATEFILANGQTSMAFSIGSNATWPVYLTVTSNATFRPVTVSVKKSTAGAADLGCGLALALDSSTNVNRVAAGVDAVWKVATNAAETAHLVFSALVGGTLTEQGRFESGAFHVYDISTPSAPADGTYIYSKTSGGTTALYYRSKGGAEIGPLATASGGGTAHNTLTGLTTGDDHTQYLLADGTRAMTGEFDTGAYATSAAHLGADPTPPVAGRHKWYFKSDGPYYINSAGTVVGPLVATTATDHAALINRDAANAHAQYALLQPDGTVQTETHFNDAGSDYDFIVEGVSAANLLHIDALAAFVGVNFTGTGLGRLHVDGGSGIDAVYALAGSAQRALYGSATTGVGVYGDATLGNAGYFTRNAATPTSGTPVVDILEDHASSPETALRVATDGTGSALVAKIGAAEVLTVGNAALTINTGSGNYDLIVNGDTIANLLQVDTSADLVQVNSASTTGRLNVERTGSTALYAASTAGFATVLASTSSSATEGALKATSTTGIGGRFESTLGKCLSVYRNANLSSPVVAEIRQDHASNSAAVLAIYNAGTGDGFQIWDTSGTSRIFKVNASGQTWASPSLTATSGTLRGLVADTTTAPTGNSTATAFGGYFLNTLPNSNTYTATGLCGGLSKADCGSASPGTVTTVWGLEAVGLRSGTADVTNLYGVRARVENTNGSGAVTVAAAVLIDAPVNSGSITGLYGLLQDSADPNSLTGALMVGSSAMPNAAAIVEMNSTTQGVLFPRMTNTQRDAISTPPDGLVIYSTTDGKFYGRASGAWAALN